MLIATLVTNPAARLLSERLARHAAERVGATGTDWLGEAVACDLALPKGIDKASAEGALREALAGEPVDVVVQAAEGRLKKILIADMDSTMIEQECIDELAEEVGIKSAVAAITERTMRGEMDFEPALRQRVKLLEGLDTEVIGRIIRNRITIAPGAEALVRTMRAHGGYTALVSGGFTSFTGPIAAMIGFDENRANRLEISDGRLTGRVQDPVLGRAAKAEALVEIAACRKLDPRDAIAVGDGANDLDMLRLAGAGVAMHAKPVVAAEADIRIDHADLTALLFMQGYRERDFLR